MLLSRDFGAGLPWDEFWLRAAAPRMPWAAKLRMPWAATRRMHWKSGTDAQDRMPRT